MNVLKVTIIGILIGSSSAFAICSPHDNLVSPYEKLQRNGLTNCIEQASKETKVKALVSPDGQVGSKGTELTVFNCDGKTAILSTKFPQKCPGGYGPDEISIEVF